MKSIQIIAPKHDTGVESILNSVHDQVVDYWQVDSARERTVTTVLVDAPHAQEVIDRVTPLLQKTGSLTVSEVESSLKTDSVSDDTAIRESLIKTSVRNARLSLNFLFLVVLSTLVATIGLTENNVAVVIGAMVIAPLLGPNLALSIGTALGDYRLIRQSILTLLAGLVLAIALSVGIGLWFAVDMSTHEVMTRTEVNLASVLLALASGAAAALTFTTSISSSLVGVMVAVAILPPATVLGLMLAGQHYDLLRGAALLLMVNIVSVNLAANVVLLVKKVSPRDRKEKLRAGTTHRIFLAFWVLMLAILVYWI
jgi:uncharacterized hydrophobic protein (TIGR00341 family)